jgi:hypothetical protein
MFLFTVTSRQNPGPTYPLTCWVPGCVSLGVKQRGLEADHSTTFSAEVKNGGAIPTCLHGVVLNFIYSTLSAITYKGTIKELVHLR